MEKFFTTYGFVFGVAASGDGAGHVQEPVSTSVLHQHQPS